MPVTINDPGYWRDQLLDQLIKNTTPDPRTVSSKLVPGQVDPRNADVIPGGAPMLSADDPNKAQGDANWINELLGYANKAGMSWDVNRNMKVR